MTPQVFQRRGFLRTATARLFTGRMPLLTMHWRDNNHQSVSQVLVASKAVADCPALRRILCQRKCFGQRHIPVSEEMWSSQVVPGTSTWAPPRWVRRISISGCTADTEDVGRWKKKVKVKEADLYSAFIEVPYTQDAQVRITQCYLQTTPYLPLPRKHSPDGASETEVADI